MRRLFVYLILFASGQVVAQPGNHAPLVLTHITEENGLSDNHVTCVYKDKNERLWIGTRDGLNLLDGSTIRVFKSAIGDTASLRSNFITSVTEDKMGNLWVSTADGFSRYDALHNTFHNIYLDNDQHPIGGISNLVIDEQNLFWMGTGTGLLCYDPATHQLIRYFNDSREFETDPRFSNRVNAVLAGHHHFIWLCTSDGLWRYTPATHLFTKIVHRQNTKNYQPLCLSVLEDANDNIWAGFWDAGLVKYEPASGRLTLYEVSPAENNTISHMVAIHHAGTGDDLWLNGKLVVFNTSAGVYDHLRAPLTDPDFPEVAPVYASDDGWIWLASDNGLYIYSPQRQVFDHQVYPKPITSQAISFAAYKNGMLVGAQDKSFLKWENDSGTVLKDFSYLCRNHTALLCMTPDKEGNYWMGTTDGILQVNLETGTHRWFEHKEGDSASLPRNFILNLFIDADNQLWVFPWREGIWQMDRSTGRCRQLWDGFLTENGVRKKLLISAAVQDREGNIWMADLDEGIILYDKHTRQFSKPFEKIIGSRIRANRIFIRGDEVYAALPYALINWNMHDRVLHQFVPPPELNKTIKDIYPDQKGRWWLATASGLMAFFEKDHSFRRFTTADGLYGNDVEGNLFCTPGNTMVIGAPGYCSFFRPDELAGISTIKKNIRITGFLANDQPVDINPNKPVSLRHNQNNVIVRWALPAFANPLKNHYYCQLQGIDTGWRYMGTRGEVQYANLSPGKYTLLLKATTANETAANQTEKLVFEIHPPFWKTGWFITLMALAISSLFFAGVRYISQRNLKEKLLRLEKKQAVEKERNRISQDMHDDLGSGLTKIAILSEVVKKQMQEPEKAREQLENISRSSRELVDNLQDIIWVLNPRNDTLENLGAYIREYALKFFEPFETQLQFHYPDQVPTTRLSEETRRNIFLVIKETCNNIARHAWCNTVTIAMRQEPGAIVFSITDDGKGFDTDRVRQFGNGILNMKNRMEQIGGTYAISSAPGKGTTTQIRIPV